MVQLQAIPIFMAFSTALVFVLGNVPGCPKVIGLTCVFGSAPKLIASPQNNLLSVDNCACISKPITASYFSKLAILQKYKKSLIYECFKKATKNALKHYLRAFQYEVFDVNLSCTIFLAHYFYKSADFNFLGILTSIFFFSPLR